jgi:limonene-1,2-epoxide hydrolase
MVNPMIDEFKSLYNNLNIDNISDIRKVYAQDIIFVDPFHKIEGIESLESYFRGMYQNAKDIHFDFIETVKQDDSYVIFWNMRLAHKKINQGHTYTVPGSSHIKVNQNNQVIYHRDYFDAGSMLYEKLPVLRSIISWIKKRMQ